MQRSQVNLWISCAIYMGIKHSTDPLSYLGNCLNYDKKLTHYSNTNKYLDIYPVESNYYSKPDSP